MSRLGVCTLALGVVAVLSAAPASARRAPTFAERGAIVAALPAWLRAEPVGCTVIDVIVSANGKWAEAAPVFFTRNKGCLRYAANGLFFLRRIGAARWRVVFNGSDPPPCALRVPRDLANECLVCKGDTCTAHR